ncbi:MAG: c-type cytochrome, partial [Candidatus Sericytochromatia bacterium]
GPDLAKAQAFYAQRCAGCHGGAGQGGFGPDLRPLDARTDASIAERIKKGSPKGMPPFEQALSASELAGLVAYVKSL